MRGSVKEIFPLIRPGMTVRTNADGNYGLCREFEGHVVSVNREYVSVCDGHGAKSGSGVRCSKHDQSSWYVGRDNGNALIEIIATGPLMAHEKDGLGREKPASYIT